MSVPQKFNFSILEANKKNRNYLVMAVSSIKLIDIIVENTV